MGKQVLRGLGMVAGLLCALLLVGGASGSQLSGASGPAVMAQPSSCASAKKALAAFKRTMAKKRKAFFRTHRSPKSRRAFVKRQNAKLKALKKAVTRQCRTGPPPDSDGDGSPNTQDCGPTDPAIHPGAPDAPDLAFVDSNCDGIDGNEAAAVFASTTGDDANPGTKAAPKQTLNAAVATAVAIGKTGVYASAGSYPQLAVASSVGVYGGYVAGSWSRSASNVTAVTGAPNGVLADGDTNVTLQLLAVHGLRDAAGSAYGVRAINGSALTLESVSVDAEAGGAGAPGAAGSTGAPGAAGTNGTNGTSNGSTGGGGGPGGPSAIGRAGGNGGMGGYDTGNGSPGTIGSGPTGGAPGGGGNSSGCFGGGHNGGPGLDGGPGLTGVSGAGGIGGVAGATWAGAIGQIGADGSHGSGGGGGGGGGGGQANAACNPDRGGGGGGGGAGGQGGGGAAPGGAGGGSFAIYLHNSTIAVLNSQLVANVGGKGGDGALGGTLGIGGNPGAGGIGPDDAGSGGIGGHGGIGGAGGASGGSAGGPSVGIYRAGTSQITTLTGTTITVGAGGTGGSGPGTAGSGSNGFSGQIYPP